MLKISKWLNRFCKEESGSFAMSFAVSALMLIIVVGAAIDINHATKIKKKLQTAVDVTILAAINDPSMDSPGIIRTANEWFTANGGTSTLATGVHGWIWRAGDHPGLFSNAGDKPDDVKVVLWGKVPTSFMGVFNIDNVPVRVEATATGSNAEQPFELVIAMDTTASMASFGGANWARAINAFTSMVETMDTNAADGLMDESTVAFIPFSDRVNIGNARLRRWGRGAWGATDCPAPRENPEDDLAFMLDDRPATGGDRFSRPDPFADARWWNPCPDELSPPTHRPSDIASAMSTITPSGTGRFDIGLAWAWRMLSPRWSGEWGMDSDYPSDYSNGKRKILVFFSDGFTAIYENESHTVDTPTRPWGRNRGTPEGFEHFEQLCTNIKSRGIELHMIYLDGNPNFRPYMERCATGEDYFHVVEDITSLEETLQNVAYVSGGFRIIH